MLIKSTTSTILFLSLTALVSVYTLRAQLPIDSFHTIPLWRSRLLHEDAMKKRYQDTLIDSLEREIRDWEVFYKSENDKWNTSLSIERKKFNTQVDITNSEISLKKHAESQARTFKKQRNWGYVLGAVVTTLAISRSP